MNMSRMLSALFLLFIQGSLAQRVRVEPEVVSYPGQTVTMRCQFPDPGETQLTQVSWIFEPTEGERTNIAVFHPTFGVNYPTRSPVSGRVSFVLSPPTLANPSIQIQDVRMTDEGRYICEYATYPSGNEQGVSSLVMLAKPRNLATTVTVTAGNTPVIVARCESANGRPAATISWSTALNGNATTPKKTDNPDNTVTIQSEYMLIPQPGDNGKDITCVVSHRTLTQPETYPMKLVVEYPPQVQIVGYDNNWYKGRTSAILTCQANGNPPPTTVTWRTLSGLMPETVQVQDNRLAVQKVDDSINTTFICEVRNSLGSGRDQVTVFVREQSPSTSNAGVIAGVIFACLLAILLIAGLIFFLVTHNRRQQHGYRGTGKPAGAPYDSFTRLFGSAKSSKNGTGNNGNNNTPIYRDSPQAQKGPATGSIIGGILAVIILLAIIATIVVIVRKRQRKHIDAPPTHKPPPPMKAYTDRPTISGPISDSQHMYHETHREKPVTNLLAYCDEADHCEPSQPTASYSWNQKEALFPDHDDRERNGMMGEEEEYYITSSVSRGSSFMSPAVIV